MDCTRLSKFLRLVLFVLAVRVEAVHARFDSLVDPDYHGLDRRRRRFVDQRPLGWSESAQHMVDGFLARRTDADAEAGILGRAQVTLNVTQPIVAAVGPARPRSQLAERQVEIIAYDEQALGWQLVEVHQLTNALPAQV